MASRTCRICACPGCCTRASSVRRATARDCATSTSRASRRCRASSRCVRDGSVLGVVAEHEFEAIRAMRALGASARWDERASLPQGDLYAALQALPSQTIVNADTQRGRGAGRACARGDVPARVPDARRDRSVVRGRALQGRRTDGVDAQPGRVSVARLDRRNAADAGRTRALHPRRGLGLLRTQRGRRRRRTRGAARARGARAAGSRAMDARAGAHVGAVRAGDDREGQGRPRRRRQHRRLGLRRLEQFA